MRKCAIVVALLLTALGVTAVHAEETGCLAPLSGATVGGEASAREVCTIQLAPGDRTATLSWLPGSTAYVILRVGTAENPSLMIDCSVAAGVTLWCHTNGTVTRSDFITLNFAPLTTGIQFVFPVAEASTLTLLAAEQGAGGATPFVGVAAGVFSLQGARIHQPNSNTRH
ncbi:MAG: hypothetical protein ACRDJM_02090 [Actinomycetota bacterium]